MGNIAQNQVAGPVKPRQILTAFMDIKTWLGAVMIAGVALANTAFVIFIPTFILEFGFSACMLKHSGLCLTRFIKLNFYMQWRLSYIP